MDMLFTGLRRTLYGISVAAMSLMLLLIFSQVIFRYCFGHTFEWSEELARFLFVWVVFLGSALIMGESGHLAVKLLPNKFKGTFFGLILETITNICSHTFILILIIQGSKMTRVMTFQEAPGLGISMSWVYMILPISGVLMMLYLIKDSIRLVRKFSSYMESRPVAARVR